MTIGTVKTQGTELFFNNTLGSPSDDMVKLVCPTGISGLGGPKDQIETTCLDTPGDKEYVPGLGSPGQVSVPFNLIPRETSHQILFELKDAGTVLKWIACLSEGTTAPTMSGNPSEFVAPTDRTSFRFDAYISDVNIDIATNDVVKGTLTLQRSGSITSFWYVPA